MQRTEPPPACSMRSTGATTTRSTQAASAVVLARSEARAGLRRHHEHAGAVGGAQLEHVAREGLERVEADVDHGAPPGLELAQHPRPIVRHDRFQTDDREPLADREQDVRVVDRRAVAATRCEYAGLEAELARKLLQDRAVRTRRRTGISDACDVIEHDAAGAFEVPMLELMVREIEQARDGVVTALHQLLQQLRSPLAAPRRREHRVQHDRAVVVEAHPVVRKHGIRAAGLRPVLEHVHRHTGGAQGGDHGVELVHGGRRQPRIGRRGTELEVVAVAGLGVPAESRRPDHHDRRCSSADGGCRWPARCPGRRSCAPV